MSEQLSSHDPEVASTVERVVRDLRKEIGDRLDKSSQELVKLIDDYARVKEPPTEEALTLEAQDIEAQPEPPVHEADPAKAFKALRDALAELDRGDTQEELLSRLLEQATCFASRAALFLTGVSELRGWSGVGFEGAQPVAGISLPTGGQGLWSELTEAQGSFVLEASDCAYLCSRIGARLPEEGVLIPLVLRDRVVAALYADRVTADPALSLEALQVLTYTTAQALELLPLRARRSTATLDLVVAQESGGAAASPVETPAAPVVPREAPPPDQPAVESVEALAPSEPEPALEVVEDVPVSKEIEAPPPAGLDEAEQQAGFVLESLPLLAEESELSADSEDLEEASAGDADAWTLDDETVTDQAPLETPPLPADTGVPSPEPGLFAEMEAPRDTDDDETSPALTPPDTGPIPEMLDRAMPATEAPSPGLAALEPLVEPPPHRPRPPAVDSGLGETIRLEVSETTAEPSPQEPTVPSAMPAPELEDAVTAENEGMARETQLMPLAPGPIGPRSSIPEPIEEAPPREQTVSTSEVIPPSDVKGPGWAFSPKQEEPAAGDDPTHEEARRLARLLVSEIKLYNEEQIEAGRRLGNIYEQLREDIDRSRQMYEERIDEQVRNSIDYFHQELVKMLAGGDASVLGC